MITVRLLIAPIHKGYDAAPVRYSDILHCPPPRVLEPITVDKSSSHRLSQSATLHSITRISHQNDRERIPIGMPGNEALSRFSYS
jgi:hypothetical protein